MTSEEQLAEWVKGNPIHNDELDQCCPDFSCCSDLEMAPLDERERFTKAYLEKDEETTGEMLLIFLGRMINNIADEKIYVAGNEIRNNKIH